MQQSNRSQVDPFIVMDVMEAARAAEAKGRRIIHMEVGQPGTSAPMSAQKAVTQAMADDALGYTVALGLPELRSEIAALYGKWYDLDLDPARVAVTAGSSAAFLLSFASLFDAGQRVGVGAPGYPSYRQVLKASALEAVDIQTSASAGYQPTVSDLRRQQLDGVIVASPANPTGTMLNKGQLSELMHHCSETDVSFISDEIYHGIEFEKKAVSALEVSNDCYVVNSFSKYFSMTGWRIGWMVVPEGHVRTIERLSQNMFICAPHVSQIAALGALQDEGELQGNMAVYRANRDILTKGLKDAGFTKTAPVDGAFYIYADISDFSNDSRQFCADMLDHAGVAITPGIDFDPMRGMQTVRFSYARSTDDIVEGLEKITEFMKAKVQ